MDEDSTTMAKIKRSVPHEVTKGTDINHVKKNWEMIYMPFRKSITSFYPKLFPIFKNVFHAQLKNTRLIRYSQRPVFKIWFHIALETMKNPMKSVALEKFDAIYKH